MGRTWRELVSTDDSIAMIRGWASAAGATVLPTQPDDGCRALEALDVTTHSTLGALAFHTGGVLVDHGWLRILGAGCSQLPRALDLWNFIGGEPRCAQGVLVADDAVGGFHAWFREPNTVHYLAPDTLNWEDSELGYTDWLSWALSDRLAQFYVDLRWDGWEAETQALASDRAWMIAPPLFTHGPSVGERQRRELGVDELWRLHLDFQQQLEGVPDGAEITIVRKPR